MKKLFLALAMTMMVGSVGMVFAENKELTPDEENFASGNTLVQYSESGRYTILIPDSITLDEYGNTTEMTISASNVYIPYVKILKVRVNSLNDWNIAASTYADQDKFAYALKSGDAVIADDGVVLEVYAGNTAGETNTLSLNLTEKVTKAGEYTDTLTFVAGLVDNSALMPG